MKDTKDLREWTFPYPDGVAGEDYCQQAMDSIREDSQHEDYDEDEEYGKYKISFSGMDKANNARISVDVDNGEEGHDTYTLTSEPVFIEGEGVCYSFSVEGNALILKVDSDRRPISLAVNGVCLENNLPVAPEFYESFRQTASLQEKLKSSNKGGMSWFLAFAGFSLVSMLLLVLDDRYFVISSYFVTFCTVWGYMFEELNFLLVFAGVAVLAIILLYFLARKRTIPLLLGFLLILADSLFMVYMTFESVSDFIIDYVFHAIVIFFVGRLCMARLNIRKQEKHLKDFFTTDNYYTDDAV